MPSRFHNRDRLRLDPVGILSFKPGLPSKKTTVFKHIITLWIQGPVVSFKWLIRFYSSLDETIIERKVVADTNFPRWIGITIKGKPVSDELAYTIQSQSLLRRVLDRHCNQCNIRVRRSSSGFAVGTCFLVIRV